MHVVAAVNVKDRKCEERGASSVEKMDCPGSGAEEEGANRIDSVSLVLQPGTPS